MRCQFRGGIDPNTSPLRSHGALESTACACGPRLQAARHDVQARRKLQPYQPAMRSCCAEENGVYIEGSICDDGRSGCARALGPYERCHGHRKTLSAPPSEGRRGCTPLSFFLFFRSRNGNKDWPATYATERHDTASGLDTEPEQCNNEEDEALSLLGRVAAKDTSLDSSAVHDNLVGVDGLLWFLTI